MVVYEVYSGRGRGIKTLIAHAKAPAEGYGLLNRGNASHCSRAAWVIEDSARWGRRARWHGRGAPGTESRFAGTPGMSAAVHVRGYFDPLAASLAAGRGSGNQDLTPRSSHADQGSDSQYLPA